MENLKTNIDKLTIYTDSPYEKVEKSFMKYIVDKTAINNININKIECDNTNHTEFITTEYEKYNKLGCLKYILLLR